MSRNKSQGSPRNQRGNSSAPRQIWRPWIVALAVFVTGVVGYLWFRESPRQLLQQARAIREQDPAQADELLERSIFAAGGNFPEAQLERSLLFLQQHRQHEALGCFSQIANPRDCDAAELLKLAKLALVERVDYLAELALTAAQRPGPVEVEVLRILIPLNERQDHSEIVIRDCIRLAELDPTDPMPWLTKARAHDKNREVAPALEAFQKARDRNIAGEELNETRNDMAELHLHDGNLAAARDQLEQLQTARPKSASDRLKWSHLLRLEGNFKDAANEVDAVLQKTPNDLRALELRGTILLDRGKINEATNDLTRVVVMNPYSVEAHNKLGQAYQLLHQPKQASLHLKKSRELIEYRTDLVEILKKLSNDSGNDKLRQRAAELHDALGQSAAALRLRQPK